MTDEQYQKLIFHLRIVIGLLVLMLAIQVLGTVEAVVFAGGS
jgi:hypothetical protein